MKKNAHVSSDSLYLEKLEFRPELRKTWLNFFVTNFRVVLLLIALIALWGSSSYNALPRESNPEVKIPIAVVSTLYVGASPQDMEELVTKKLETVIAGLKGLKQVTSTSRNSLSAITVEFDAKEPLDDSIRKLRDAITSAERELPVDAEDPVVREVSVDDAPIWTIAMTGPYDGFTMRKIAEDIQEEVEKLSGVREINISGGDEREFELAYDPEKLTALNISLDQANQAVSGTNHIFPAGNFEGEKYIYPVRADARLFTAAAIGAIPITHGTNGAIVYLKDVATVSENAIKKTVFSRFSLNGSTPENSLTLNLVKKTGGSVLDTLDEAKAITDRIVALHPGVKYDTTVDFAEIIREDFDQLKHDFLLTIALVFTVLFLIVGVKEALVAGLAVPLVFGVTFGVMLFAGISLNFLSNLSLLLALGLLVDDAIVVVSATKQYLKTGKFTPEEAVLLVLNDFKVVLTTTTLTTVWAFLPLLMSTGIIGEYIKSIPITVSVTLISSLFIALMINHPLAAVLERIRLTKKMFWGIIIALGIFIIYGVTHLSFWTAPLVLFSIIGIFLLRKWYVLQHGKQKLRANAELMEKEWLDDELIRKKLRTQGSGEDSSFWSRLLHGIVNFQSLLPIYEKYLRRVLQTKKSRWKTLGATLVLFLAAMALPILGIVPAEFFPAQDSNLISINIEAPIGLKLSETDKIVQTVEARLLKNPAIINFSTLVGASTDFSNVNSSATSSSHLASITLKLTDPKDRDIPSFDIATEIRNDLADIQSAKIKVEAQAGGPPVGAAFEARIQGEDLATLEKIANDLRPILASISGVRDIAISLKKAPAEYTFTLDPAKMELSDVNALSVASLLRTAISGLEVSTVLQNGNDTKIMARFAAEKIPDLQSIQNLQVLNRLRQPVFLKDVATVELKPAVEAISRIDEKRTVLLSAGADADANAAAIVSEFQQKVAASYPLPEGYEIAYGGENEQNVESVNSILSALVIAALLIISTLVVQFNSFKKAFIVLVTFPLALIGVFLGLALTQIPLSFPGLIGVLALFGIVVKNAIILIDKINLNIKAGIPFEEAIIDAGKSRLEAIFITSICTILGLIPVTISNASWTALGSAVIFGLTLSSLLTLFIVPTLFRTMINEKDRF